MNLLAKIQYYEKLVKIASLLDKINKAQNEAHIAAKKARKLYIQYLNLK